MKQLSNYIAAVISVQFQQTYVRKAQWSKKKWTIWNYFTPLTYWAM